MAFLMSAYGLVVGTLVPFLFVLTLVVFVHEMGHFLVARWCGIKVEAFSLGFGPELIGFNDRHNTRWKLSLIPLGGYVKFLGDSNATSLGTDEVKAAEPGSFPAAKLWARAAVVFAGPLFNFILAIAIFATLYTSYGRPMTPARIDSVQAGSAAERAGFQPGDMVISINGTQIESFNDIQLIVSLASNEHLAVVVDRNGEKLTLDAVPDQKEKPDEFGNHPRMGVLGIRHEKPDFVIRHYSVPEAVVEGVKETYTIVSTTFTYIHRVIAGRESADQLGGPISVAKYSGQAANVGFVTLINLAAFLSVSIGLMNLFPVPMLDGGHLVFYLVEAIRGRPLSAKVQEMSFRVGLAMVLALMVFATWNDISGLVGRG